MPDTDHVDHLREQWAREMPDVATAHMAVYGRILRIARLLDAPVSAVMAAQGLDRGEFDVLAGLRRAGAPFALSPTELYRSLLISSGGLTHRLKRLEARGLVRRRPNDRDGRGLMVELTPAGRTAVEAALAADAALEARLMAALPAADLAELERLLRHLLHATSAALDNPGTE